MDSDLVADLISVCLGECPGNIHLAVFDIDRCHKFHIDSLINIKSEDP